MGLEYIEGIILGTTDALARNIASLAVPHSAFAQWAEEQASIIGDSKMPENEKLIAAGVVIACGGDPGRLPIAHLGSRYLNHHDLGIALRDLKSIALFVGEPRYDEDSDTCHPRDFKNLFRYAEDVLFLGEIVIGNRLQWCPRNPSYVPILKDLLKDCWGKYEFQTCEAKVIGNVDDIEILRDIENIVRLN
jgi:hypothetical protein